MYLGNWDDVGGWIDVGICAGRIKMSTIDWRIYSKIWLQWGSLDIFSSCVDIKKWQTYLYTGLCGLGPGEELLVCGLGLLWGPCLSFLNGSFPLEVCQLDYYTLQTCLWPPVGKVINPNLVCFPVIFAEMNPQVLTLDTFLKILVDIPTYAC